MCEGSEHEVSWDDGRTIVEIGMLAEGLENFKFSVHETSNPAILQLQGAGHYGR